jgi:hypothetical protein
VSRKHRRRRTTPPSRGPHDAGSCFAGRTWPAEADLELSSFRVFPKPQRTAWESAASFSLAGSPAEDARHAWGMPTSTQRCLQLSCGLDDVRIRLVPLLHLLEKLVQRLWALVGGELDQCLDSSCPDGRERWLRDSSFAAPGLYLTAVLTRSGAKQVKCVWVKQPIIVPCASVRECHPNIIRGSRARPERPRAPAPIPDT